MQIVVENLSHVYSEKNKDISVKALDGVCLTVDEGDFFGIVGETGSGKSTFIQHLNGLIKIQKNRGTITVGNFDLSDKKCDYKVLRSKLGMVFQYPEYQLFAETVYQDVAFALKNFFPDLSEQEKTSRIKEAIELVGLNYQEVKDKSPFELSGGQKRRVAIAGVIVARPEILILDEPAAGLDPKGKRHFLSLIKSLHRDFVKTVIIVSHDMNIISEYCTKVAVFKGGKVLGVGSPREIFTNEEIIKNSRLDIPTTYYLEKQLKRSGVSIESDLTTDDFIEKVAKAFGGRK